jgi:hypothetical protein
MNFSPHSRSKTRNSNVALLLQPTLHNFGALASINHLDGITYRRNCQKTRKSFVALLLPHLFPVSPLLRYSYKKMGGDPLPANNFFADNRNSQSFQSLTTNDQNASKITQCFLSLTDHFSRNYLCFLSLTEKGGVGVHLEVERRILRKAEWKGILPGSR